MGSVATRHIGGGAVWWKSPSTALARGRDGQPPDLLYNAILALAPLARNSQKHPVIISADVHLYQGLFQET
jgi:hypothetical protein